MADHKKYQSGVFTRSLHSVQPLNDENRGANGAAKDEFEYATRESKSPMLRSSVWECFHGYTL